ncbi:MAG TPA: hypothetical protein VG965_02025, partial [Patescibacteria group bacterium]|nr:hypothetical protein [Patescibacteria group bacterium]
PKTATNGSQQNNICYEANSATPTDFAVWTTLESGNELAKIGTAGTPCASGRGIVYFQYTLGKVQIGCMGGTGASSSPVGTGNTMSPGPLQP